MLICFVTRTLTEIQIFIHKGLDPNMTCCFCDLFLRWSVELPFINIRGWNICYYCTCAVVMYYVAFYHMWNGESLFSPCINWILPHSIEKRLKMTFLGCFGFSLSFFYLINIIYFSFWKDNITNCRLKLFHASYCDHQMSWTEFAKEFVCLFTLL